MAQDRYGQFGGGDWRDRDRDRERGWGREGGFGRDEERRSFGPEGRRGGEDRDRGAWGFDERAGAAARGRDLGGYYGHGEEFGRDEYSRREGGVFAGADYRGEGRREFGRGPGRYDQDEVRAVRAARAERRGGQRRLHEGIHKGEGMHRGHGPKGYRRADERVREDVCERLTDDPLLDARNIEVEVRNCEVILSGSVETRVDKRRAELLAERCAGVENVQNNLRAQTSQGEGLRQAGGSGEGWRPSPG